MKDPTDDKEFALRAKARFDDSVERLDASVLSRLNKGHHRVLERRPTELARTAWSRWVPAGGVVAAALVTAVIMRGTDVENIPLEAPTDFDILLESESLEMIEDLEFYSWIEEANVAGGSDVS